MQQPVGNGEEVSDADLTDITGSDTSEDAGKDHKMRVAIASSEKEESCNNALVEDHSANLRISMWW
jgi:hypothetical protein